MNELELRHPPFSSKCNYANLTAVKINKTTLLLFIFMQSNELNNLTCRLNKIIYINSPTNQPHIIPVVDRRSGGGCVYIFC